MAPTDTFVKQVKHSGKAAGDRYTDGSIMYLLVKAARKCRRMDYTHADKRKTLALGVYPRTAMKLVVRFFMGAWGIKHYWSTVTI